MQSFCPCSLFVKVRLREQRHPAVSLFGDPFKLNRNSLDNTNRPFKIAIKFRREAPSTIPRNDRNTKCHGENAVCAKTGAFMLTQRPLVLPLTFFHSYESDRFSSRSRQFALNNPVLLTSLSPTHALSGTRRVPIERESVLQSVDSRNLSYRIRTQRDDRHRDVQFAGEDHGTLRRAWAPGVEASYRTGAIEQVRLRLLERS